MKSKKLLAFIIMAVAMALFFDSAYLSFDAEHQLKSMLSFVGIAVALNVSIILANSETETN